MKRRIRWHIYYSKSEVLRTLRTKKLTTLVGGGRKWRIIDIDRESYFFEFDRRKCFATQMRLDDARRVLRLGAHEVDKVAEVKVNSGEAFKWQGALEILSQTVLCRPDPIDIQVAAPITEPKRQVTCNKFFSSEEEFCGSCCMLDPDMQIELNLVIRRKPCPKELNLDLKTDRIWSDKLIDCHVMGHQTWTFFPRSGRDLFSCSVSVISRLVCKAGQLEYPEICNLSICPEL